MHCPKNSSLRVRHPCVFFGTSEQFHPSTLHWVSSLWFWNTSPALQNLLAPTVTISLGGRDPSPALPLLSPPYPAEPPSPAKAPQTDPEERPAGGLRSEDHHLHSSSIPGVPTLATPGTPATGQELPMDCDKTAAPFPNRKLASLCRNCVPKR